MTNVEVDVSRALELKKMFTFNLRSCVVRAIINRKLEKLFEDYLLQEKND